MHEHAHAAKSAEVTRPAHDAVAKKAYAIALVRKLRAQEIKTAVVSSSNNCAIDVWQYFQVTHDVEFMNSYGAELILEIAHFWSSSACFKHERGRPHGAMAGTVALRLTRDSLTIRGRDAAATNDIAVGESGLST